MPVPSKEPLTAAEQKQLEEKVALWKTSKIGRELVRKVGKKTVEGIIWSVEQDDFTGPPAKVTSTYHVLWDVDGFNHSKKRLLKAMMPGDESSESELLTEGQLDGDANITLRTAFSHPELVSPIQILQAKSWRWRSLKPEQQHALLDWTPNRELADRKAAQKRMGDAVLAQLKQENNADVKGRGCAAALQNGRTAKRRRPAPADAKEDEEDEEEDIEVPIDEDGSDEETSEDGQQEVVPAPKPRGKPANQQQPPAKKQPPAKQPPAKKQRGPATRTSAAGASAGPSAPRAPPSPGSPSGEPVAGSAESEEMQDAVSNQSGGTRDGQGLDDFMPDPKVMLQQRVAAKAAASGKKAMSAGGGGGGSKADGSKGSGSRGGSGRAGGAGSGKAKKSQASAQPTRQLPSPLAEAGPSDDGEMVTLLPGSVPPRVPMRLTLSDGDKLLQEYRNQAFAADEEFEPEHIVAERPAGAPREYLVKWRNYELDPHDWSAYSDLAETAVLDAWEKEHPPPQGAGRPPPPPEPVPAPTRGKGAGGGGGKKKRK